MNLNELQINCWGTIDEINCKESTSRRLMDLGLIEGTKISPVLISPLGDPTAYEIRKSIIAIRKEDSKLIKIKK